VFEWLIEIELFLMFVSLLTFDRSLYLRSFSTFSLKGDFILFSLGGIGF
jgi:hypothetical protein